MLFEMLTGRRAFEGSDVSETLANVLKSEPEWGRLPAGTSPSVQRLLRRCLEKDSARRTRDIGDASLDLDDLTERGSEGVVPDVSPRKSRAIPVAMVAGLVAICLVVGAVAALRLRPQPRPSPVWLSVASPAEPFGFRISPIVSPDGTQVAFWAQDDKSVSRLWVKAIHSPTARSLPGTEGTADMGAGRPAAWSPDGRSLAYIAGGQLARIDVAGGAPQRLAVGGVSPRGLAWGAAGVILFVPSSAGSGIYKISATGGSPEPVAIGSMPRAAEWPAFLPDGRHFLFFVTSLLAESEPVGVYVGDLATLESKRILDVDSRAEYANGHLFFVREGSLFAQAFDPSRLSASGDPFRVADDVGRMGGDQPAYAFSVSPAGTIALSDAPPLPAAQLTWLDRTGKVVGRLGEPGRLFGFAISADERSIVVEQSGGPREPTPSLWSMDHGSGVLTLVTANGRAPVWEPQGNGLLYQERGTRLRRREAGANHDEDIRLPDGPRPWPEDISRDGRVLLLRRDEQDTQADLWTLDPRDPRSIAPYIRTKANEQQARFSPDARWVAYTSDESGREEVYVDSFPRPGRKIRASADAERMTLSAPQPLFTIAGLASASSYRQQIAVSAKGDRFLFNMLVPEPRPTTLTVILNWSPPGEP